MFSLDNFLEADHIPAPYQSGEEMWNDRHISQKMLEAHLSPDTDAASYRPQKIGAICEYLTRALGLAPGKSVVDLGCGPGLYANLLSQKGFGVRGIDRSENSIAYARKHHAQNGAEFFCASYLEPFGQSVFDSSIMISEDYGVLCPKNRRLILKNIFSALKPGGYFAFDVSSLFAYEAKKEKHSPRWYTSLGGFWRPHPHAVLEKNFFYPEISATCDLYMVFDHEFRVYRNWQTFFTKSSISLELESAGFKIVKVLSNLWGEEYREDSPTIGVICSKG